MLIPLEAVATVLPARSVHVPVTDCAGPSVATVTGAATEATPDRASSQVNVTVTSRSVHVPAT